MSEEAIHHYRAVSRETQVDLCRYNRIKLFVVSHENVLMLTRLFKLSGR
jgi:hypothetical protein